MRIPRKGGLLHRDDPGREGHASARSGRGRRHHLRAGRPGVRGDVGGGSGTLRGRRPDEGHGRGVCGGGPGLPQYVGTYTVDPDAGTVSHHVDQSVFPNFNGATLVRSYRFSDGSQRLKLSTPPPPFGGTTVVATLIWEPIGGRGTAMAAARQPSTARQAPRRSWSAQASFPMPWRSAQSDDRRWRPPRRPWRAGYRQDGVRAAAGNHGLYWLTANLADEGPLVLAVDDAHWADLASLRFLGHLLRRIEGLPALVVLASREDGLPPEFVHAVRSQSRTQSCACRC